MTKHRLGADGKLYFKYNKGAEYELHPQFADPFRYLVLSCELDEQTETEYYRIESAGEELPARFSVSQLEFMLSHRPCEQVSVGEPVELPLLAEEVKAFFAAKRKDVNKANAAENAKLKGTAYFSIDTAKRSITENLRLFRSVGDERAAALEKKLQELSAEQEKILTEKGIDLKVLTKTPDCKECGDSGMKDGRICACALAMADKIKAYNAEVRLSRR